jgi:DNA helicase-2/ATP-dependent DNA helicase PcrA
MNHAAGSIKVLTLNAWGNRLVRSTIPKARLIANQWDQKLVLDNALQPVWMDFPLIRAALLDRKQIRAGRAIFEVMEKLKSLGFRHDQISVSELDAHVAWLTSLGLNVELDNIATALEEFGIANSKEDFVVTMSHEFLNFWQSATETLFSQGHYTFEDQKYRPLLWLNDQIERGDAWTGAARTAHLVIDEFQDINPLDLALISRLKKINDASLTLVGDDDQAIFEWRGASPEFILNPEKYFGETFETHILETNYRSPRNIVEVSQKLIRNNVRRVDKTVVAISQVDALIEVRKFASVAQCVEETTRFVSDLLSDSNIKSIALISRKRSQILPYQITFSSKEIPFFAAEDLNLGLSKAFEELQILLAIRSQAMLESPFGPSPSELVMKMADKIRPFTLSKADRTSLLAHFKEHKPKTISESVQCLRGYNGPLKGSNTDGANSREFASTMQRFLDATTVTGALQAISQGFAGLQADWGKAAEDIYYTDPPFFYLAAMAEPYGSDFDNFTKDVRVALDRLANVPVEDVLDDSFDENQVDSRLHLMTALRAKGREFDVVIVLDSNDEIWPIRYAKTPAQLEQERRLFYVATTRAKQRLTFVYSEGFFQNAESSEVEANMANLRIDTLSPSGPVKNVWDFATLRPTPYIREMGL